MKKDKIITTNNLNNINSNNNNNNINSNNNNKTIIINNFGNENIEHITKKLLEKEIIKIANKNWDNCFRKQLEYKDINYNMLNIKLIDIHLLLTKLIYFSKKENHTLKKEFDKYYIKYNDWTEIELELLNLKVLSKQQEVLVKLKNSKLINNHSFIKIIENYFGGDYDNKLKIETGKIEFILSSKKYEMLTKLLNHELQNHDLEINHNEMIV